MSSRPSPPARPSLASPPAYPMDPVLKSIITSTWHVLDQPPPPTLREILGAYKAKGDGDRDMLMTMLNAKSAEDQRIASMASLHRTMLEMYNTPLPPSGSHTHDSHSAHIYQPHFPTPPPTTSYHNSPPQPSHSYPVQTESSVRLQRQSHSTSDARRERDRERGDRDSAMAVPTVRKRRRTSRSPPPPQRDHRSRHAIPDTRPTPPHDLPSPYSSSSTHGSPRSRESMAIGSLLSEPDSGPIHSTTGRRTSSERSTASTSPAPMRR